jgi:ABC-type uncharacterized transport system permease subunit
MTPLFYLVAGLYALASVTYFIYLFGRGESTLRIARWTMAAALVAHLAMIGLLCTRQLNPLRDIRGALSLSGFLLAAGYLLTTLRTRLGSVGAFIAPLVLALLISARLTPQDLTAAGGASGALGRLHIALSALGVAAFGLAAAVAVIYLFQEAALKKKRIGLLYRRSPPLNTLDGVGRKLILIGFPVFTLAVITGLIWVSRLPGRDGLRVEYLISGFTWVVFALMILGRLTAGWRGRRAAWLTVVGFLATFAVLLIYVGRRVLGG